MLDENGNFKSTEIFINNEIKGKTKGTFIEDNTHNKDRKFIFLGVALGAFIASIFFCIAAVVTNGFLLPSLINNRAAFTASNDPNALPDNLFDQKLKDIKKIIDANFIFDYKDSALQNGVFKGMLDSLNDPYSQYYTAEEFKSAMEQFDGEYSGIGAVISISKDKKEMSITSVYPDSPAEKAGFMSGDILIAIDNEKITPEMSLENVVRLIKGPKGSKVKITVRRKGKKSKVTLTAVRDEIKVQTVYSDLIEKNIGYMRITEFSSNTSKEFKKVYDSLVKQGAESMIIDLRDNPGGSFNAVCEILDGFLSDGVIVYTKDKNGNKDYVNADSDVYYDKKMVVLVNSNSASASEIFSGAVKDRKLGKLIGETTYGKGIVQNTIPLTDGTAIKLTISRYYTASGNEIHEKGITPDIKVIYREPKKVDNKEYSFKDDNQIMRAIKLLREGK